MIDKAYRISDVVNDQFLRIPLSLLANPKYRAMSLEAKFVYSLLLNRLTLSQKNGWIDKEQQVYLIYKREDIADILNISYKKSISAFKELIDNDLLFEKRQGRGFPNLLYVLKAELEDEHAIEFEENFDKSDETPDENDLENADNPRRTQICQNGTSRSADLAYQEVPNSHIKNCQNDTSRSAETEHQRNIDNINPDIINNNIYVQTDAQIAPEQTSVNSDEELSKIFSLCEIHRFDPDIQIVLKDAIVRMYYSDTLKIRNAHLPQAVIRSYLKRIDKELLMTAVQKLQENEKIFADSLGYLMSIILNCICEKNIGKILKPSPDSTNQEKLFSAFDAFWEKYPKKKGKYDARKAFNTLNPDSVLLTLMLNAIDEQKKTDEWQKSNGKFIPYPATWLIGRRWEDEEHTDVYQKETSFDVKLAEKQARENPKDFGSMKNKQRNRNEALRKAKIT